MLLFVVISIIILITVVLLHYKRHFKFRLKCTNPEGTRRFTATEVESSVSGETGSGWPVTFIKRKSSTTKPRMSRVDSVNAFIQEAKRYRCMFTSADNEDYDFYPISFFFYLSFLIIICIIIIVRCFIFETYLNINDIPHVFAISLHPRYNPLETHSIDITHITDWILLYSIMIVSTWESLFSFYRYYLTYFTTKSFAEPNMCRIFMLFSVYAVIYMMIFIFYIHFYYWIFPLIGLAHFMFNTVCTYQFAGILIKNYTLFISMDTTQQNMNLNISILSSVYFMRKTSLICSVLQSFSLVLLSIFDNIDIVYYLPLIWSVSSCIFTLNFVRNREYIYMKLYKYNKYCRCMNNMSKTGRKTSRSKRKDSDDDNIVRKGRDDNDTKRDTVDLKAPAFNTDPETPNSNKSLVEDLKIALDEPQIAFHKSNKKIKQYQSPSVPSAIERQSIVKLPPKRPLISFSQSANFAIGNTKAFMKGKALDILGLSPMKPFKITINQPLINDVEAREDTIEMDDSIVIRGTPSSVPVTPLSLSYPLDIPTPINEEEEDIKLDIVVDVIEEEEKKDDVMEQDGDLNLEQLNLNEVVRSLNVLVTAAFISRQSVNNLKEISRYIHKR